MTYAVAFISYCSCYFDLGEMKIACHGLQSDLNGVSAVVAHVNAIAVTKSQSGEEQGLEQEISIYIIYIILYICISISILGSLLSNVKYYLSSPL